MTHPAKRVAINTGYLYAQMVITVLMSLYVTRLVLAALGTNDFGIFNVVGGVISMLSFLHAAMASATMRFMSYAEGEGNIEKLKNIFNVSIVLHILIGFIAVLFIEVVGYFLFHDMLKIAPERISAAKLVYHFMVISTFFTIISVPYDAVLNAHENMLLMAILRILQVVLNLGTAIYITHITSDKLIAYGFLMGLIPVVLIVPKQIYCHFKYNEVTLQIKRYHSKSLFKEMTSFAGWNFLGASSSMIANYGQGLVLNMFFGTVVNAAQGIANQINGQLSAFSGTMLKALNPVIAKSEGAGNRTLMLKASMIGSKLSFFLMVLFFIPVMIEMPYIFKLWLKDVPEYAVIFGRLLLIKTLIEQLYITIGTSIAAVGNIRKFQMYGSFLAFLPLLITYILFYLHYSPTALYVVFILSSILRAVQTIYFAKINCSLSVKEYINNVVLRSTISFLIIYSLSILPLFLIQEGLIRLILVILISFVSFVCTSWFVGLTNEEQLRIKEITNKLLNKFQLKYRMKSTF
jgi:O-antigen/teichoic acid export membrane protein